MATETMQVGPGQFTIGESTELLNFSAQVTEIKLTPSIDQGDSIPVLDGTEIEGERKESYTLEGSMLQDLGATNSTTEYLYKNSGARKPFLYVPNTARGKQIKGTLIVDPIDIGGEAKTKPKSDFKFSCLGKPEITTIDAKAGS